MTVTIEAHGYKFFATGEGLDESSTAFATAVHNIQQMLIALPPPDVRELWLGSVIPENGHIEDTAVIDRLVELADAAAALPDRQLVAVLSIPH